MVFKSPFIILNFSREKTHKPTKTKIAVIIEWKLFLVKNKVSVFGEAYFLLICFDCLDKWPRNY